MPNDDSVFLGEAITALNARPGLPNNPDAGLNPWAFTE
jgi:hypothetical protein